MPMFQERYTKTQIQRKKQIVAFNAEGNARAKNSARVRHCKAGQPLNTMPRAIVAVFGCDGIRVSEEDCFL